MSQKQHAKHSPSRLEELELCGHFKRVDMEDAADEGTLLHAACEAESYAGLNEEQRTLVMSALSDVIHIKASCTNVLWDEKETKVVLNDLTWGTVDRLIVDKTPEGVYAHVADYKFGRKEVTAPRDNFQIAAYCAATLEMYPDVARVYGYIIAPRTGMEPMVTNPPFLREDLPVIRKRIETLYEKLDDPFTPPCPNASLCSMCARAARCPAMTQMATTVAPRMGLPLPSDFALEGIATSRDRALAEQLRRIFKNWDEQVAEHNRSYVEAGGTIEGYKLVSRSTGAKVPSENIKPAVEILAANGYSRDEIIGSMSLSIPKLAKAHVEVTPKAKETQTKIHIQTLLAELTVSGTASWLAPIKAAKGELPE